MNNLSWMIYLAEASGSLSFVLGLAAVVFLFAAVCKTLAVFCDDFETGNPKTRRKGRIYFAAAFKFAAPLAAASVVLPSSQTVYAIAASEMGEKALNSETGGKAIKALDAWLDRQIAGEKAR